MLLVAATALQTGLLTSVHPGRATLAIDMRIRTPRRKGVSSRASKANGLAIEGGYGRAAPKSGAGKQEAAEAGWGGKLGHVHVLLLKDCALGTTGAIVQMSLPHFKNAVERKGVGRLARPREIEQGCGWTAPATAAAAAAAAAPADAGPPASAQASEADAQVHDDTRPVIE